MAAEQLLNQAEQVKTMADTLAAAATDLGTQAVLVAQQAGAENLPFIVTALTVLVLAVFVGYYVVWSVTPALHSPLMGVTNAISSVIIVGALLAAGPEEFGISTVFGFLAIVLASVNIFGGFIVTNRMLAMFKKKK
jgi:NAD(P) transhydrogenase subunit alpha